MRAERGTHRERVEALIFISNNFITISFGIGACSGTQVRREPTGSAMRMPFVFF